TISEWLGRTASGDRAELRALADEAPAWRLVTTTPDARLGPRCPFFERCFVTQARRAAGKADLVVVNHHLYFADLALRAQHPGAAILPDHDAVIFDEAHALEEVATEHFGVAVSSARLAALGRDAARASPGAAGAPVGAVDAAGDALMPALRWRPAGLTPPGDAVRVRAPDDLFEGDRRAAWFRLDAAVEELALRAGRVAGDEAATAV